MTAPTPSAPTTPAGTATSLLERASGGHLRLALTFAGQGQPPLDELGALWRQHPEVHSTIERAGELLADLAAHPDSRSQGAMVEGADVARWMADPDLAPSARALAEPAIAYPLALICQAATWEVLLGIGLNRAAPAITVLAGHSQGTLAALMIAECGADSPPSWPVMERHLRASWRLGLHLGRPDCHASATPMAEIDGLRPDQVRAAITQANAELEPALQIDLALINSATRSVVAGPLAGLEALRRAVADRVRWTPLAVGAPFHSRHLASAARSARHDSHLRAALPSIATLPLVVLDPADGSDLRRGADPLRAVIDGQFTTPVRWDVTCRALERHGVDWVLDLGPGTAVARLTADNLRGGPVHSLALASPEGRRRLVTAGTTPVGPALDYGQFAARPLQTADGREGVDTRFTRATGYPPVILAGMTPTTADVPIVAAAANAGYLAELAGGGQADRPTLERRLRELSEALEPGRQVAWNTLLLDPHLWNLHYARDGLAVRASAAGAPICGMTISAGVPDATDALTILDRLEGHGLHLNSFKAGTVDQIRRVLAIADASPHRTIAIHIEGGQAGGHHSWVPLDELLLATYHQLRQRPNLLVCAGGGVGTPERAFELLTGSWSRHYEERPMPVDAVLIGTAAMACAEATASPSVKQALVAAAGSDALPAVGGGVTSGRSALGADIHLLDNAAAATARLVERLAADPQERQRRRPEVIAALNAGAKPYLGDLEEMTYAQAIARLTELCAMGRHGPYDDGPWGHRDWRMLVLDTYRRWAARLDPAQSGSVAAPIGRPGDLDDPQVALERFVGALPQATTSLMHPADADWLVARCRHSPRPVPFVPVIDDGLARWYGADTLWQAQHPAFDADQVAVIPGPSAVAAITRADEPVAELLQRIEVGVRRGLQDMAARPVMRPHAACEGLAPPPLGQLAADRPGPLANLCRAPAILRHPAGSQMLANPLWSLVAPGDRFDIDYGADGAIHALRCVPADGRSGERLIATVDSQGRTTVEAHSADGPWRTWQILPSGEGHHAPALMPATAEQIGTAVLGEFLGAPPPAPPRRARCHGARWSADAGRMQAFHRSVRHDGPGAALDLALSLAWPAMARALAAPPMGDAARRVLHTHHRVDPGPAWPPQPDEAGRTRARVVHVDAPPGHGATLRCLAELECARGPLATVASELRLPQGPPHDGLLRRHHHPVRMAAGQLDRSAAEVLRLALRDCGITHEPWPGRPMQIVAHLETLDDGVHAHHRARGWLTQPDSPPLTIAEVVRGATGSEHPLGAALAVIGAAAPEPQSRPVRELARTQVRTPEFMDAHAQVAGDHNPLHRLTLAARAAGLDQPIVHGAWTAARMAAWLVADQAGGRAAALRRWRVDFTAPVATGSRLELIAEREAVIDGRRVVRVRAEQDGTTAAIGHAEVDRVGRALVFPGQGVHRPGMADAVCQRSAAAAQMWRRLDTHTHERLGFSLDEVVRANPPSLAIGDGTVRRHPAGVLYRTEFTQPALVALACAQVAELREIGVVGTIAAAAGHSVGEFSALVALGALEPEAAVELVFHRGEAMQDAVSRDADGVSPYAMAAVDPAACGCDVHRLEELVAEVAAEFGPLEVVNHNAHGRQYAVAGTVAAVEHLTARLGGRAPGTRPPVVRLRGIDIPFHASPLGRVGARLRPHLERLLSDDAARAAHGRWVSNVTGRLFAPHREARSTLIDLLARQAANPVRWAEGWDTLVRAAGSGGAGVNEVVEVGPAHAPVLTNLAQMGPAPTEVAILHSERDHDRVRDLDQPDPPPVAAPDAAATPAPPVTTPSSHGATPGEQIVDEGPDAASALALVLALQARRMRPDQIAPDDTLDDLFQGASSRRNQALVDLGREFGLSAADGIHERSIGEISSMLADRVGAYRFPGPYLRGALAAGVQRALAGSAIGASAARRHLEGRGLPPGAAERVLADLALETREGPSVRSGPVGRLAAGEATGRALIDAAAAHTAARMGWVLDAGGPAPALPPVAADSSRAERALRRAAQSIVADLADPHATGDDTADRAADRARLALLDSELGPEWAERIRPLFDPERRVELTSPWAWARGDLLALFHDGLADRLPEGSIAAEASRLAIHRNDPPLAAHAARLAWRARQAGNPQLGAALESILTGPVGGLAPEGVRPGPEGPVADPRRPVDVVHSLEAGAPAGPVRMASSALSGAVAERLERALRTAVDCSEHVALVTGASPGSIGASAVGHLLRGGARVVVATSTLTPARRRWYRALYRRMAAPTAQLHLIPANLANLSDVQALAAWCHRPTAVSIGPPRPEPAPLAPTVVLPFAAMPTDGTPASVGGEAEVAIRLQLLGVERLIGALARQDVPTPPLVVLPLSPNHGLLGNDGVYPETKAALEVVAGRWRAEHSLWGARVGVLGARIGWVRGTGLMGAADRLAEVAERDRGLRTFSADEMGWIVAHAATTPVVRAAAADGPVHLDATGGLGDDPELADHLRERAEHLAAVARRDRRTAALIGAWRDRIGPPADDHATMVDVLPCPAPQGDPTPSAAPRRRHQLAPADLVVVVGTGELGPGGGGRTRFELETDGTPGPASVVELARLCGLITPDRHGGESTWRDATTGDPVAEEQIAERYRAQVGERIGVRPLHDDGDLDHRGIEVLTAVTLAEPLVVEVADRAQAEHLRDADPAHTTIAPPAEPSGPWRVTRAAGAQVRVPGRIAHTRRVAGQLPRGYDPTVFGVPADMVAAADPIASVNLATVVDAFWDAGLTPEELMAAVDPSMVANTQGAGTGGMVSRRRLLLDHLLGRERQADRLQESLGNVPSAHAVQSFIGSYGSMIHPVAACATAAVSVEVAVDKIRSGQAQVVVAGGFDDISTDGVVGFADMGATVGSDRLDAAGIAPHEASRAGDLRRDGFVEAQGGGTALLVRGDIAVDLGLPVRGVIAYAASFADGIHTSIPAPGMGLLAAARGGPDSPLAQALADLGLGPDDIGVISKHDTSTALNDPNEADLHERILRALGRTPGEPVPVVSQKTVTGHAKGGAAAWQLDGLLRMLATGRIPANPHLESADPRMAAGGHLVAGHPGLRCAPAAPLRAGLLASLGFGHVSAMVVVAHPQSFLEAVPEAQWSEYVRRAAARTARGQQARARALLGRGPSARRTDRGVGGGSDAERRAAEAAMLLDPAGRPQRSPA